MDLMGISSGTLIAIAVVAVILLVGLLLLRLVFHVATSLLRLGCLLIALLVIGGLILSWVLGF